MRIQRRFLQSFAFLIREEGLGCLTFSLPACLDVMSRATAALLLPHDNEQEDISRQAKVTERMRKTVMALLND